MNKTFEFRKIRDFGTVMNHSFDFIKLEYKRLGKALLIYALPVFVVTGILLILIQNSMANTFDSSAQSPTNILKNFSWGTMAYSYLIQLLNYTVLSTVVYSFINLYRKKQADFKVEYLKSSLLKIGFKLLIAYIVVGVILVVATCLLIIPGIYLGVVFSLVAPIIVFEEVGLGKSMSRSFEVIKGNWWKTFGIIAIGAAIIYILSIILSIPLIVTTAAKSLHAATNHTQPKIFSSGYFIYSTIIEIIKLFAYTLVLVFISVQYFSLVEEKERPTLQERIDKLDDKNA